MSVNNHIGRIVSLAKNGKAEIYEELSKQSRDELNAYNKNEVVKSIQRFFLNKSFEEVNKFVGTDVNQIEFIVSDFTTRAQYKVYMVKEEYSWKLVWNKRTFLKHS